MDQITPRSAINKSIPLNSLSPQNDEIDLISLWLVLVERKKIIFVAAVLSMLAGAAFIATSSHTYIYRTSIEIGGDISNAGNGEQGGNTQFIESATSTLAKLTETYIPLTLNEYSHETGPNATPIEVSATTPPDSSLILLESIGTQDTRDTHIDIHHRVLKRITDDHDKLLLAPRQAINDHITQLEFELAKLKAPNYYQLQLDRHKEKLALAQQTLTNLTDTRLTDVSEKELNKNIADAEARLVSIIRNNELLKERLAQIDEQKKLIRQEIQELESFILEYTATRSKAGTEATDEAKAMTILLIDSSIQKTQQRLSNLKTRLHIGLAAEKKELENKIAENILAQEKQRKQISILNSKLIRSHAVTEQTIEKQTPIINRMKLELENFKDEHERKISQLNIKIDKARRQLSLIRDTHAITPTVTIGNKQASPQAILALSLILGIFAGVIAALLRSFFESAKSRRKNNKILVPGSGSEHKQLESTSETKHAAP